jgi:multicomponent Na+:H+ antiporter subunit F
MDVVTLVCLAVLGVASLVSLVRLAIGPSLADRVVALDTLVIVLLCGVVVAAARYRSDLFLDVAVVVSLVGFVGTVTVSRFIEGRGAR